MFKFLNNVKAETLEWAHCVHKTCMFFSDSRKHNFSHKFVCTLLPSYILTYHQQTPSKKVCLTLFNETIPHKLIEKEHGFCSLQETHYPLAEIKLSLL